MEIVYDDEDTEQLTRIQIIDGMKTYQKHAKEDTNKINVQVNLDAASVENDEENVEANADDGDAILGSNTNFLDPRFNLLDVITPTATQNRLSYLVELVIDKCQKGISNEALKCRLRKDAATFGVVDMPTHVRAIAKCLGARTLEEVTRHRCGNDSCSYAWPGAVHRNEYDNNDQCPECGTPRYIRKGGITKPRRVFYYFGASQAIEALHRNPVFKANWKKNMDISINAYRSSPDAQRLNGATHGEALAESNGLYISMADGFQSHNSKTQSITG